MADFERLDLSRVHWEAVLPRLGVEARFLSKRQGPCPRCAGRTKFRFDNRNNKGTWICNDCGAGDGIGLALLAGLYTDAAEVVRAIREMEPALRSYVRPAAPSHSQGLRAVCRAIWAGTTSVQPDDPVARYLARRVPGLSVVPPCLRFHPSLGLPVDLAEEARARGLPLAYPAMVAAVVNVDRKVVGLHRTYLTLSGEKAPFENVKFSLGSIKGGAIRLFAATHMVGLAEGIETALAVWVMGKGRVPLWATLSAQGLEDVVLPATVCKVHTFGDNDCNGRGFVAQDKAVRRFLAEGRQATPHYPEKVGSDFADQWLATTDRRVVPLRSVA